MRLDEALKQAQVCPGCRTPVPFTRKGVIVACDRCREPLRFCTGCYRLDLASVLHCTDETCAGAQVPWTQAAAGGNDCWPLVGGGGHRNGRIQRPSFHKARLLWQATPLLENDAAFGPVNAHGIVCVVSRRGWCLLFAEPGLPARSASGSGPPSVPLRLQENQITGGVGVTAEPVFDEALLIGLEDGNLIRVRLGSLKGETVATLPMAITDVLPLREGWAVITADQALQVIDSEGRVRARFDPKMLFDLLGARGAVVDSIQVLPPVSDREQVFVLYSLRLLSGGTISALVRFADNVFSGLALLEVCVESLMTAGGHLMLFARDVGFHVPLEDVERVSEGAGALTLQAFRLPCLPAHPPVLISDDQLGCIGLADGIFYRFQAMPHGTSTRAGSHFPKTLHTRPVASGTHFLYASDDYVYLDQVPISPQLQGRPHPSVSCANGRAFVSTGRPAGLYAFELT